MANLSGDEIVYVVEVEDENDWVGELVFFDKAEAIEWRDHYRMTYPHVEIDERPMWRMVRDWNDLNRP